MANRPHNFRALSKPKKISKKDQRHYLPYLPLLIFVVGTFLLSLIQPLQKTGVLAYGTDLSTSGLLQSTNEKRAQNGAGSLRINSSLNAAAQSKANDMIARNYWAHVTPDGQQPWVFMDSAGYKYQKAGENLAYGFATSSDTITGWMNSQTHKDNMLDTAFSEVGFGFANGADFNNNGKETVVVAMYGRPQVLGTSNVSTQPTATTPVQSATKVSADTKPADTSQPTPTQLAPTPVTTDSKDIIEPKSVPVARVQTLTKGRAPWALFGVGLITGLAVMMILVKHAAALRHLLRNSEKFVLHHPLLDSVLVSMVLFGSFLLQTTGFIR